jgi:hypothetical protein
MRIPPLRHLSEQGSVLITMTIVGGIICAIVTASMITLSSNSLKNAYGRVAWTKAFYTAENATVWAAQNTFNTSPDAGSSNYYSTADGTLPLTSLVHNDPSFKGAWVKVVQPPGDAANVFVVTSSARVDDKVRTLQTTITTRPVSEVFDYEYFLNNWGWWWGNTITGNGAQRANWDFDFRYDPTVNGSILAADYVEENEQPYNQSTPPFAGLAGEDPTNLVHQGAPRVTMPNLLNFTNYVATAMTNTADNGIWIGSTQVVAGVLPNQTGSSDPGGNAGNLTPQTGIYLNGTSNQPIVIKGTVVIPGDVVIKGQITGQGTLYVGGNLYIANDLTYANGPDFSTPPETMPPAERDQWVQENQSKDLVAFAVRGSILAGDVNNNDWVTWCYDYPGSGLENVGDESHLGMDGIANTPDDNIPFLHPDGSMSTWYDADGDGTTNGNYNYANDIEMTSNRESYIQGYPTNQLGQPISYDQVATDDMGTLEGIFYTDHAAAMRLAESVATFYGVIVSRNEQIIFQNYLHLNYDSRVNSRYNSNPNQFINLGLPYGEAIQVSSFEELPPDWANL